MELAAYKSGWKQCTTGAQQIFPDNDLQVLWKTVEGMIDLAWVYQEVHIAILKDEYVVNRLAGYNGEIIPGRGNNYQQRSRREGAIV